MSDENKITRVEKTKDPRRVEAGRRLGTNSKYFKAEKRERLEAQRERDEVESEESEFPSETMFIIGFITVIVLGGVYLAKKPQEPPKSNPEPKKTTNFVGFG